MTSNDFAAGVQACRAKLEELAQGHDAFMERGWSYFKHMKLCDAKHWMTAKGERIAVAEMDDGHLVNTVKFLRRVGPKAQLAELLINVVSTPRLTPPLDDVHVQMLEEMAAERVDDFLTRTCPPYRAMAARYDACVEKIDEQAREWAEESLVDPWGNS